MNDGTADSQTALVRNDWQAWLVLRHFLPARLLRLLVCEVVRIASGGRLSLADLFEEIYVNVPIWNESWVVRPRPGKQGYTAALQSWVRSIVWQSDEGGRFDDVEREQSREFMSGVFLDTVTRLATADFNLPHAPMDEALNGFANDMQPSLQCLWQAFKVAKNGQGSTEPSKLWEEVTARIDSVALPLRAIMLKHIADLLADADAWKHALDGYQNVVSLLKSWEAPEELRDVAGAWRTVTIQSQACATGIVEGNGGAGKLLEGLLDKATLEIDPVPAINAGLDAVNSRSSLENPDFHDPRVSQLSSPLLHSYHDATSALRSWLKGKHQDAAQSFWSLLRRQIALGAATDIRTTKAWYARSLLEEIAEELDKRENERGFEMAVRLLIEAEKPESVERIVWKSSLVDAYVTKATLIEGLVAHAAAHEGSKFQRTLVLVELFKTWALLLTPSRTALTLLMWKHIARIATEFKATFEGSTDVGRPALKALQELGKKRPELRGDVAREVADAICAKLNEKFLWGQAEAADSALPYTDAFDDNSLSSVVLAVLGVLEAEDPLRDFWPLNRAAIRVLVDRNVRLRLGGDNSFDRRCLEQILRFGLAEGSRQVVLFFHLADFDPKLLEGGTLQTRIKTALGNVRKGALQVNSSDVTDNIDALLIAPIIAGHGGVRDALEGLSLILQSGAGDRGGIGIPHIDGPLLLLTERLQSIRSALPQPRDWFEKSLESIGEHLAELWNLAATKPLLFAPFAFPPHTRPSDVLVHNCAFASLRFAQAIGQEKRMRESLGRASENPALKGPLSLARATHASRAKVAKEDLDLAPNEDRDSFYESLGRRIRQVHALPEEDARRLCLQLVENCLRLGPHAADAALLVAAANLGLHADVRKCGLDNYTARVREDRGTRLLLLPILDLFAVDSQDPK